MHGAPAGTVKGTDHPLAMSSTESVSATSRTCHGKMEEGGKNDLVVGLLVLGSGEFGKNRAGDGVATNQGAP